MDSFESAFAALTQPINGQYPRPWMTDTPHPQSAQVFIIGRNQAKTYSADGLTHARHMDALFNRNGESCRELYLEMAGNKSSRTRQNIDKFRQLLLERGVKDVLETNVICYSTPMSADLASVEHSGGRDHGTRIFRTLLEMVCPRILIAHGAGTIDDLSKVLGRRLPMPSQTPGAPVCIQFEQTAIFLVRSLAPSEWNKWSSWAWPHLQQLADEVAERLQRNVRPDRL